MTTLSKAEIEAYAVKIAEPNFGVWSIKTMIGCLPKAGLEAVINRAAEIARESGEMESNDLP